MLVGRGSLGPPKSGRLGLLKVAWASTDGDVARGICIGVAVVALAPLLGVVVGVAIVAPGIAAGTRVVVAAVEEVVVLVAPLAPATHFPSPKRTPAGIMGCKKPKTALQHRNACDVAFV